jgi:hypothetical protein
MRLNHTGMKVETVALASQVRPSMILVTLLVLACGGSTAEAPTSLGESSTGIEESDAVTDTTLELGDTQAAELDSFIDQLDAPEPIPDTTSQPDVVELDPDANELDPDIECPIFVPVDEPDFGKPPQPPSSYAPCSPGSPCADGEYCTADFYQQWEGSEPFGNCVRLCFHPKSDTPSEMGCDVTQFCVAAFTCIQLSEDSECDKERGINVEWKAWCGPKNRTRGGLGGNWDYSQCPCDNPASGMTPEEKATCEEAWAEMQNQ